MSAWLRRCAAPILAVLAVTAAGCGGLLPTPPQRQLYRVTAVTRFPTDLPSARGPVLIVGSVAAPGGIDTARIALSHTPVSIDYYGGAEWTDRAPTLVHDALIDSLENSGAFAAVAADSLSISGNYRLEPELRDFEAVYDSPNGPPRAQVAIMLKLVRLPAQTIVAQTLLRDQEPAAANAIPQVVAAINTALDKVLQQAVTWTASNAALSPSRR